jgi:hypothetical protein
MDSSSSEYDDYNTDTSTESDKKTLYSDDELIKLMKIDHTYPETTDPNFQEKIFKKREFYYHRIPERENLDTYAKIKAYREASCKGSFKLLPQQAFLGNFLNEHTPFQSVLVYHGMGVGKCLLGSEFVYVNDLLVTMKDLHDNLSNNIFQIDYENGVWTKPKHDLYVNSYDSVTDEIKLKKIDKLYKEFIDQDVIKITLENGLEINLTKAHKLLNNGNWTKSDDLQVGSYVAIPSILYNNSKDTQDLYDEFIKIVVAYFYLSELRNTSKSSAQDQVVFNMNLNECIKFFKSNNINITPDSVPNFIMSASLHTIKVFLLTYHNLTNNTITSTSKYFIYQIFHLAKLLRISSNITFQNYRYTITLNFLDCLSNVNNNKCIEYVKIIDIQEYHYRDYVYDLEIVDTHNYCASSMITHNTCAAITIAEQFKPLVHKYGTKIYVVLPGPLIKENWKNELLNCTGETYLKKHDINTLINNDDKKKIKGIAVNTAMQYYTFPSYKSFYKKVLGEKITEKTVTDDERVKITFRKTAEGDFERDFTSDRIISLDNTVLIVEEAHNLTNNSYGDSLLKVIKNSHNLKIVLLTGTPMKNLASDIVELLNFIRPVDDPVMRDKVFTRETNHTMDLVPGGIDYLKKMSRGYVSYLRGGDPLTMAKRVDVGTIGNGLLFTRVTKCYMLDFQQKTYDTTENTNDVLDRNSAAVANFAFPLISDNKELVGTYGIEGVNSVKNQLKSNGEALNKRIATDILKISDSSKNRNDLIYINDKTNMITGKFLQGENLRHFSIKFYDCLQNLNNLIDSKTGSVTAFIYSNLVVVGVEVFQEVLLMNGYLEYNENESTYKIDPQSTRCYLCGKSKSEHDVKDKHTFKPATFITVTGKVSDDASEVVIPEEKQQILNNVFSSVDNIDGKHIKFVVGSRVMNEGLSLHNTAEVHILDVYYNLSKVDQTIGRAIRHCRHYDVMSEENPFPEVKVYKYCVSLEKINKDKLSSEEDLYRKAELKYLLVKKVERALKESAIDCPLNRAGNIFNEELEQYKNCIPPEKVTDPNTQVVCPAECDFTNCNYKCDEKDLNDKYYDEEKKQYMKLSKDQIDMSTFNNNLAMSEIKFAKEKIKELFRVKYLYLLKDILNYVKNSYDNDKKDLFDDFFVFAALDALVPVTENDFNKFSDTIYDKYNRPGYIIYVSKYYIFQPFDQPSNVPMYYRSTLDKPIQNSLSLVNYLKNIKGVGESTELKIADDTSTKVGFYEFDHSYYESRPEFKYVGTIDKEPSKKKAKEELLDVFKLRKQRGKILDKKRGTEIYSLYGSVCYNSFKKGELFKIAKILDAHIGTDKTRPNVCNNIRDRLLFLEKYSTKKKGDKFTYMMIPKNHPEYKFPYNLEDRKDHVLGVIKSEMGNIVTPTIKEHKKKIDNYDTVSYTIEIKNSNKLDDFKNVLKNNGFKLEKDTYILDIN